MSRQKSTMFTFSVFADRARDKKRQKRVSKFREKWLEETQVHYNIPIALYKMKYWKHYAPTNMFPATTFLYSKCQIYSSLHPA